MAGPLIPIALAIAQHAAPALLRHFGVGEDKTEAAAKVIDLAQRVTGASTPADALVAIKADADARARFAERALDLDADLEKAHLADRADARKRDVALASAGVRNRRADLMVALDVLGLLAGLAGMMALGYVRARYPEAISEGVFGALLAQLSTITSFFGLCLRDAHQFEFGSSRGSQAKDQFLAGSTKR